MKDAIDKLADDIKASVVEICAKVAEIHRISRPENEFQNGINEAVFQIAAKIRELSAKKAPTSEQAEQLTKRAV